MKADFFSHHGSEIIELVRTFFEKNSTVLDDISKTIIAALKNGNKILICGNGGSAADSQHIAGEFMNKLYLIRKALPAIALSTDSSVLTCIGNDIDFSEVFSRQIEALGSKGDIAICISTSGTSANVLKAIESAQKCGMTTIGFTGGNGGDMPDLCDHCLHVSNTSQTPRIQEIHAMSYHLIIEKVEKEMFKS